MRWAIGILLLGLALCGRMLWDAHDELARAAASGSPRQQTIHLRRALSAHFPGNPWSRSAAQRLLAQARQAEQQGQREQALFVLRELRSGLVALRSFYQPLADELRRSAAAIVRLRAATPGVSALSVARLVRPPAPDALWVAVGLAGFVLSVLGSLCFFWRGYDRSGRPLPARRWLMLLIVGGFGLFGLGMSLA